MGRKILYHFILYYMNSKGWIQAVLFPLETKFNTSAKRLAFIKKMGIKPLKRQHKTETYYRYRITEPLENTEKRIIKNNPNVHFIYEFLN